jgi:type I site-specific restriction-modification system R (restriction) subunit
MTTERKSSQQPVEKYISKLIKKCQETEPYQDIIWKCRMLLPFVDDLNPTQKRLLAKALEDMLERTAKEVHKLTTALQQNRPQKQMHKLLEGVVE